MIETEITHKSYLKYEAMKARVYLRFLRFLPNETTSHKVYSTITNHSTILTIRFRATEHFLVSLDTHFFDLLQCCQNKLIHLTREY